MADIENEGVAIDTATHTTYESQENSQGKTTVSLSKETWIPDSAKQNYHNQRLGQSKWAFRLSFWGSLAGFAIIAWCFKESIASRNVQWVGIISGSVVEVVSALFYYLSNKANEKISEFFKELTIDANVKEALRLVDKVKNDDIRDELLVKLSLHLSGINEERICKNTKEICNNKENRE